MALYKEGCGHPTEWNLRVVNNGTKYTYCIGCIVYDNPFIKFNRDATKKEKAKKKEKHDDQSWIDKDLLK
jgi:hypothetical protein